MTDCSKCLFYNPENDEEHRSGQDVVIVGQEEPDNHYCFAFEPIPKKYFEGKAQCPKFIERQ